MQFRDLHSQYIKLKPKIDKEIEKVLNEGEFISGRQVGRLEDELKEYVGVKHCITCGNGTDALSLALMAWNIGEGDAVFVPNFTFFASAEVPAFHGATIIFVDVEADTFNISSESLESAIQYVIKEGKLRPKVIIAVDLFGQPADYIILRKIADKYGLLILEDGAQGFGGSLKNKRVCSFGDISTTSFFPAKPLGCYGDGGAVFTNNNKWADLIESYKIHGKGSHKYENIRVGVNSRLDTIQAAILLVKLEALLEYELEDVNLIADYYNESLEKYIKVPRIKTGRYSSWAQYSVLFDSKKQRDEAKEFLKKYNIPSMIYYPIPLNEQVALKNMPTQIVDLKVSKYLSDRILSLPIHPYLNKNDQNVIIDKVKEYCYMLN